MIAQKDSSIDHPATPWGAPAPLIAVLAVVLAGMALIVFVVAAACAGSAGVTVVFFISVLLSRVLAVEMAGLWRRRKKDPTRHGEQ